MVLWVISMFIDVGIVGLVFLLVSLNVSSLLNVVCKFIVFCVVLFVVLFDFVVMRVWEFFVGVFIGFIFYY